MAFRYHYGDIIVMGDFNIDFQCESIERRKLLNVFTSYNLAPCSLVRNTPYFTFRYQLPVLLIMILFMLVLMTNILKYAMLWLIIRIIRYYMRNSYSLMQRP
ncbi:hypothetical protein PR048_020987 [Dryococelus australis]|uniref:Endonuclease/exonuclease/phosphatase domain-containing protein n=1 Tax=Dryococelus australis TaxID=614101 RepID=A0ABQ9GWY7_9NEOP|nr:hypothetical protein PR048_020987 [Dryococelus australis]